jgi:gluconokinase
MVIVLMGVCGCGKTTVGQALAQQLAWPFHDADQFHSAENVAKMANSQALDDSDRVPWLQAMANAIGQWIDQGQNAILACSALKADYRSMMIGTADHEQVKFVFLNGSKTLIAQRLAARKGHYMPADLLDSQLQTLEAPADALCVDIAPEPKIIANSIQKSLNISDSPSAPA